MRLKAYVLAVVAAAGTMSALAGMTVRHSTEISVAVAVLLTVLVMQGEVLTIALRSRTVVEDINLIEAPLVPVLFYCGGWEAMAIVGVGELAANLIRRNQLIKTTFNTAQWLVASSAGLLVLNGIREGYGGTARNAAALVAGIAVAYAINQALFAGVLWLATGTHRAPGATAAAWIGRGVGLAGSAGLGVVLAAAYSWSPWALLVAFVVLPLVNLASRGYANVRADQIRLEGLQRATHALVSLDEELALPAFLREARVTFEADLAELVLFGARGHSTHMCSDGGCSRRVGAHDLAEMLSRTLSEPAHVASSKTSPDIAHAVESTGHQQLLAAPLKAGTGTVGMLLFYDRVGMEGFESGELTVAAALARELVGFLERAALVREIDEERRKLNDILESTSDGIVSIDAEGVVTSWNAGLAAITGYTPDEMIGTRHFGLLRPRDAGGRDVIIERWSDAIDTAGLPADMQVVNADGELVWLSCSYSRILADEGRGDVLVIVARNITQARELERLKDDFVAVVSHELRTPLVPIKGWAQTLINRGDRLNDDQRRTAVQSILAQAQKLESLVLNILEASRVEAGQVDGEDLVDVTAVTVHLVDDILAARPDRAVRVRPPHTACHVRGSSVWVERAVSNLVANALKYSPDHEPVDVEISVDADDVVVAVTDRGPGIAPDAQERIFERFERLEETQKQTGTGLGLYITRRLARALGGDVSVTSVPGTGSTFLLRLPLAQLTAMPGQRSVDDHDDTVVNLR